MLAAAAAVLSLASPRSKPQDKARTRGYVGVDTRQCCGGDEGSEACGWFKMCSVHLAWHGRQVSTFSSLSGQARCWMVVVDSEASSVTLFLKKLICDLGSWTSDSIGYHLPTVGPPGLAKVSLTALAGKLHMSPPLTSHWWELVTWSHLFARKIGECSPFLGSHSQLQ